MSWISREQPQKSYRSISVEAERIYDIRKDNITRNNSANRAQKVILSRLIFNKWNQKLEFKDFNMQGFF